MCVPVFTNPVSIKKNIYVKLSMYMYLNPITIAPKLNYYVPVEESDENKTATDIFVHLQSVFRRAFLEF